jgi:protein-S-isoprenylcysteine O-methyltransferase Ste14
MRIGIAVVILGEALRVWASGYIHKGKKLARNGPYAHIRHPLYTGNFMLGLGMCIMGASIPFLLLYVALFVTVYLGIAKSEEKKMEETFGADYALYKKNVPVFIPRVTGWAVPGSAPERFHFERVLRNREYNACLGILAVALVLYGKFLVLP